MEAGAQFVHYRHFAIACGQAHDGFDLAAFRVAEARAEDVLGRHHTFQRRFDDFLRRGGHHEERETVAVDILEQFGQECDVRFQADTLADLDEMLTADFPEFGVVQQKIGEFAALLDQVDLRQAVHSRVEILDADDIGQHFAGVVETEGLVEITEQ